MKTKIPKILEFYIEGKDLGKYKVLEEIYSKNAEVEFEINSDNISFPAKIIGNKEIAKILSKKFNTKYNHIKTYYLSKPTENQFNINHQKWLVIMRDIASKKTKIGTGYYNWNLKKEDEKITIEKHKIFIEAMLEIEDLQMSELQRLQQHLKYPWIESNDILMVFNSNPKFEKIAEYIIKRI